jgi:hypothetical protein
VNWFVVVVVLGVEHVEGDEHDDGVVAVVVIIDWFGDGEWVRLRLGACCCLGDEQADEDELSLQQQRKAN